jgi:hypothetical protein
MRLVTIACCTAALLLAAGPSLAQGEGQGKGKGKNRGTESSENFDVEKAVGAAVGTVIGAAVFGTDERRIIVDYYNRHGATPDRLPPSIAKNLARGKPLPPGIAKKVLPGDLLARLPQRVGHERVIAGADVLLIEVASGVITDVLRDVLRRR